MSIGKNYDMFGVKDVVISSIVLKRQLKGNFIFSNNGLITLILQFPNILQI